MKLIFCDTFCVWNDSWLLLLIWLSVYFRIVSLRSNALPRPQLDSFSNFLTSVSPTIKWDPPPVAAMFWKYSAIQSETVFMYFKLQMGIVILLEENFSPFLAFFKWLEIHIVVFDYLIMYIRNWANENHDTVNNYM